MESLQRPARSGVRALPTAPVHGPNACPHFGKGGYPGTVTVGRALRCAPSLRTHPNTAPLERPPCSASGRAQLGTAHGRKKPRAFENARGRCWAASCGHPFRSINCPDWKRNPLSADARGRIRVRSGSPSGRRPGRAPRPARPWQTRSSSPSPSNARR